MTPKGHCFFCNDLTEFAVGKIPICEFCGNDLFLFLKKAQKIVHKYEKTNESEMDEGAGGY